MSERVLTKSPDKPLQVLIADDDVEAIVPLRLALQNFGFRITTAFDGPEALKQMAHKHFDLVFLDINMPGLSGLDVLAKMEDFQQHGEAIVRLHLHPSPVHKGDFYETKH